MDSFRYRDGELHAEGVPLTDLAERHGTPLYVYSRETILDHYGKLVRAFAEIEPIICYSVKANGCLAVLKLLKDAGSGFDVVSGGELARVRAVGGEMTKTVFAGVGKTDAEIEAAVEAGILLFNVESESELGRISTIAENRGGRVRVALRVNPDVDARTHHHVTTGKSGSKFGIDLRQAAGIVRRAASFPGVVIDGVHMHIGSQITEVEPYVEALAKLAGFVLEHRSPATPIGFTNIGGGFGINYANEDARTAGEFAAALVPALRQIGGRAIMEPGRFIVGNAGVLLTRVLHVKRSGKRSFAVVDAGMNDLVRPALYQAYHEIWPVRSKPPPPQRGGPPGFEATLIITDVVGPVCETVDTFATGRPLPPVGRGDLLAVFGAGAYGQSMASNYNSRPRVAEILVSGPAGFLVRRRETADDLLAPEIVPEGL